MISDNETIQGIVHSLRKVNRGFYQLLREEADVLDSTVLQLMVLRSLSKKPNISLGELAEPLQVGNSTMSGVVERLVSAGLVVRKRSSEDRRTLTMRLTRNGEEKTEEAFGENSLLKRKLSKLLEIPNEDIEHLLRTHEQILVKLQHEGDETKNESF